MEIFKIYGKSLFKSFHKATMFKVRASFIWNHSVAIFQVLVVTVFETRNVDPFSSASH